MRTESTLSELAVFFRLSPLLQKSVPLSHVLACRLSTNLSYVHSYRVCYHVSSRQKYLIFRFSMRIHRSKLCTVSILNFGSYWKHFKPHYYPDLPMPIADHCLVGLVDGEPVAHVAVTPFFQSSYYEATRLVVTPECQGAGIGARSASGTWT